MLMAFVMTMADWLIAGGTPSDQSDAFSHFPTSTFVQLFVVKAAFATDAHRMLPATSDLRDVDARITLREAQRDDFVFLFRLIGCVA